MHKKQLTEQEIRTRFITPAIKNAGWGAAQIREEYSITAGRIIARGGSCKREKAKFADYVLFHKPHQSLKQKTITMLLEQECSRRWIMPNA